MAVRVIGSCASSSRARRACASSAGVRCSSGMVAAVRSPGSLAIAVLLRYLRTHPIDDLRGLSARARGDRRRRAFLSALAADARRSVEVMKQLRQRAIRDLVEQRPIRTQQELAAALRERGFRTTQATISRDVAELGLVKARRGGDPGLRPAAAPRARPTPTRRGAAPHASCATCRWRSARPGLLLVLKHAARLGPRRSRQRSTGRAGRRWRARFLEGRPPARRRRLFRHPERST